MSTTILSPRVHSIIDRTLDLASRLAAHARVIDPDQTQGWSHLSLELLNGLNRFVTRLEANSGEQSPAHVHTVLNLFHLHLMLLATLVENAEELQPQVSAVPFDIADMIARFLVEIGLFAKDAFAAHSQGVTVPLREVTTASIKMRSLEEAFIAAMHGDHDAAVEAQRLLLAFVGSAAADRVMPLPWELGGDAAL